VLVSAKRDAATARRFFQRALTMLKGSPSEVVTDAAPIYPAVAEDLMPSARHHVERHANNPIEADHSQLKHRLRPMRGLRTDRTTQVIIADTLSCRTSAESTTNSPLTRQPPNGSPLRSLNSPERSDRETAVNPTRPTIRQRNGARERVRDTEVRQSKQHDGPSSCSDRHRLAGGLSNQSTHDAPVRP
jgi:hypothetical protein